HAPTSALHLHTGGDCATRRSGESTSPVVPASTTSLRDVARAACRNRPPHFRSARPPSPSRTARRRSADLSYQVRQEPPCSAPPDDGESLCRLSRTAPASGCHR